MLKKLILLVFLIASVAVVRADDDSDESKETKDPKDDEDVCKQPPIQPGPFACLGAFPKWTFNAEEKTCQPYMYGGCRGTNNLFNSEFECLAKCNRKAFLRARARARTANGDEEKTSTAVTLPASVKGQQPELCSLPPISGPMACMAFIPSWTFNAISGACERYVYGGCGKTANLFKTEEECKAVCTATARASGVPGGRETCLLPVAKGPCFGFMKRYAFSKEKNRCESFTYGGCQGNLNNFVTADQCFEACGGSLPSLSQECEQTTCPSSNKWYLERGCRPEYKGRACCPTSFTCPETKSSTGVCHYRGLSYQAGEAIVAIIEDHPCKQDCVCESSTEHRGGAHIRCNEVACGSVKLPKMAGCKYVTKPGKCCPKVECPKDEEKDSSEEKTEDTCTLNGKDYAKGETIPTGDPCKECTCGKKFTGLDGPGCREIHCLIDNRIGCVPIYTEGVCCPTDYKCVIDNNIVKQDAIKPIIVGEPGKESVMTLPGVIGPVEPAKSVKSGRCDLPKDIGACRMHAPSFYYDSEQRKCLSFIYGGCRGNENRFETEQECLATCQPSDRVAGQQGPFITTAGGAATLPASIPNELAPSQGTKTGPLITTSGGAATLPALIPDGPAPSQEAKNGPSITTSGGASTLPALIPNEPTSPEGGNAEPSITVGNAVTLPAQLPEDQKAKNGRCALSKDTGPCRLALESYFYDADKQDCVLFYYGGCKGNENRFQTIEECRQICNVQVTNTAPEVTGAVLVAEPDVCDLPQETGPCKGQVPSYSYNTATGSCELFWFGGCRGNANRFETEIECQNRCTNVTVADVSTPAPELNHCELPAEAGHCRAVKTRYFYNVGAGECQTFEYGGCRGNKNNFKTAEQCQSECQKAAGGTVQQPEQPEVSKTNKDETRCKLPADVGFCRAFQQRFYYDGVEKVCKPFSWGGCLGNSNNFATDEECMAACGRASRPWMAERNGVALGARNLPWNTVDESENNLEAGRSVEIARLDQVCVLGNWTLNLGDKLETEDPCEECVCSTPPDVTCTRHVCPPPPSIESAICKEEYVAGQCCPNYSCVSANPPFIDVCQGVQCQADERCTVQQQESADGTWVPPAGVCVKNNAQQ